MARNRIYGFDLEPGFYNLKLKETLINSMKPVIASEARQSHAI